MQLDYFRLILSDIQQRAKHATARFDAGKIVCKMIDGEWVSGHPQIVERDDGRFLVVLETDGAMTYLDLDKVMLVTVR